MGGDEFLVILENVGASRAKKYVELLMSNDKNYKTDNFALDISAGAYTTKSCGTSLDECIAKSDHQMYKAKAIKKKNIKK